ncbi:MAG TPA: sulfite exporter TauE/SafE family protein, partial [bacterium]|nr:sulfite exporter TauE/SafE family protein [bacterium]
MYLPLEIFCLAVIGLLTGMAAGILGIGGGIIFVPTVYYFYSLQNVDPEIAIKSAIGTSLAVIFFTAISGAYSHFQKRNYIEKALIWIVSGSMIGAFVGAKIALLIHGKNLNVIIGTLLFLVSIRMFLENKRNDSNDDETSKKSKDEPKKST